MTPHQFTSPARVEEIRPTERQGAHGPDSAPSAPVALDDGTPVGGPFTPATVPAEPPRR
jgi:hypothetical protein